MVIVADVKPGLAMERSDDLFTRRRRASKKVTRLGRWGGAEEGWGGTEDDGESNRIESNQIKSWLLQRMIE